MLRPLTLWVDVVLPVGHINHSMEWRRHTIHAYKTYSRKDMMHTEEIHLHKLISKLQNLVNLQWFIVSDCMSVCMSVVVCLCVSICLSVCRCQESDVDKAMAVLCLSLCLSLCACLSLCLSVTLCSSLFLLVSICLSVCHCQESDVDKAVAALCLSVCLSVYLCLCLSICLSVIVRSLTLTGLWQLCGWSVVLIVVSDSVDLSLMSCLAVER